MTEDEPLGSDGARGRLTSLDHEHLVGPQRHNSVGIERNPPTLVRLCALFDEVVADTHNASLDRQPSPVEVNVAPTESKKLAPSSSRRCGQHDEGG